MRTMQALGCSLSWSNFQLPLLGGERPQCSSAPPISGATNSTATNTNSTTPPPPIVVAAARHRSRNLFQGGAAPGLPLPPSPPPAAGPAADGRSSGFSGGTSFSSLAGMLDQLMQTRLVKEWQVWSPAILTEHTT